MSFLLGSIEQQALRSLKTLHQVNEYGLRGLNIIRIEADGVVNPNDAQLTFTIDSSKLAGNIMLNRVQCEVEFQVITTGAMNPGYYAAGAGWNNNLGNVGYLQSPSNGAMDALCVNKAFSSLELSNKQVQLVQDSRTPEKIDVLSRLLSAKNLEESGVFLDNVYGSITEKAGGQWELNSFTDSATVSAEYARACSAEDILERNLFWKRNTNDQYIKKKSNVFKDNNGIVVAPAPLPFPWTQFTDGSAFRYDWISASVPAGSSQTTVYTVKEDLLHDIFVSQYQENPVYMGFPTTDLVLTFTKSNVLNSLYKTSNASITGIEVKILSMKLNILTYNYGLIDVPIKDYYIPFYSETVHQQIIQLSTTTLSENENKIMQTRQYNSVPQYFIIYSQEPTSSSGTHPNRQNSLKPTKINKLRLQIDNETDGPLFNMNMDEIRHRTLTNLYDDPQTVDAVFRHLVKTATNLATNVATFNATKNWTNGNLLSSRSAFAQNRSFLDGLVVLKCGKDIRLPSDVCVGQDRKISFTFTIDFDLVSNPSTPVDPGTNLASCSFYQQAYFPSMYKFSPTQGLLKAERFVVSDGEFRNLVEATNNKVKNSGHSNNVVFTSQHPLMVGSAFGNLYDWARSKVPMAKAIADISSKVADQFDSDLARKISHASKKLSSLVGNGKKGRPKRQYK